MTVYHQHELAGLSLHKAFYELKRAARHEAMEYVALEATKPVCGLIQGTTLYVSPLGTVECMAILEEGVWRYVWSYAFAGERSHRNMGIVSAEKHYQAITKVG